MVRRYDENELVDQTGGETFFAAGQLVAADDTQIELVRSDPLLDDLGVCDVEPELDTGMA
jgi:hypothetical protein